MALLTSDMVWLVEETVQLPGGGSQRVLVPQLYTRVREGDADGNSSLVSGGEVELQVKQNLTNSGSIAGREVTRLEADNLINSGLIQSNELDIRSRTDITNSGGTLIAGNSLLLNAGRDINSASELRGSDERYLDRTAGIYVSNDQGKLVLQGVHNVNLDATLIANNGNNSTMLIAAGNDLNLGTLKTVHTETGNWGKDTYRYLTQQDEIGSQISANGNLQLTAGNDLNSRGALVRAADDLTVTAGHNLTAGAAESSYHLTEHSKQTSKGFLSSYSLETHDEVEATNKQASQFSGTR